MVRPQDGDTVDAWDFFFSNTKKFGVMTRSRRRRHGQQAREPSGGRIIRPVIDGRFHALFWRHFHLLK